MLGFSYQLCQPGWPGRPQDLVNPGQQLGPGAEGRIGHGQRPVSASWCPARRRQRRDPAGRARGGRRRERAPAAPPPAYSACPLCCLRPAHTGRSLGAESQRLSHAEQGDQGLWPLPSIATHNRLHGRSDGSPRQLTLETGRLGTQGDGPGPCCRRRRPRRLSTRASGIGGKSTVGSSISSRARSGPGPSTSPTNPLFIMHYWNPAAEIQTPSPSGHPTFTSARNSASHDPAVAAQLLAPVARPWRSRLPGPGRSPGHRRDRSPRSHDQRRRQHVELRHDGVDAAFRRR
jgi:hypothetical protein